MTSNPLGELDMELDAVLETEEQLRWDRYRWWVAGWTVVMACWSMVGALAFWLVLTEEPYALALACLVALTVGLVITSVLGQMSRSRWLRAQQLQGVRRGRAMP